MPFSIRTKMQMKMSAFNAVKLESYIAVIFAQNHSIMNVVN